MNNLFKSLVIVALIIECNGITITLEQGRLTGATREDRHGNSFHSFLSIPFAKPPIGQLRFADPLPPVPWRGILNATTDLVSCPQTFEGRTVGQEDCLYLNVHTRNLPCGPELKPVIVFIFGGSLIEGSGTSLYYGPEFLMAGDIVLITINYRLALLGFLNSRDPSLKIPGNAGFKDQTMALRWVKKNIAKFGGDPDNVTIMGESAGGTSVNAHMVSPLSKGLFHRAIAMSAVVGNNFGRGVNDSIVPVARRLGITATDRGEMLKQLRNVPFGDIVAANTNSTVPIHQLVETNPIVEYQHPNAFLPIDPAIAFETGNYTQVPFMLGYTNNEGIFPQVGNRLATGRPYIPEDLGPLIPYNVRASPSQLEDLKREIKEFYFGNEEPNEGNMDKINRLVTDAVFIAPIEEVIRRQAVTQTSAPIYFYVFSADTEMNYYKRMTNETAKFPGASHVDDLGYAFKNMYTPEIKPGSPEDISITNYVNLITGFARNGKPDRKLNWKPFTLEKQDYLDIGGVSLQPKTMPDEKSFKFWKSVYDRYSGNNTRLVAY